MPSRARPLRLSRASRPAAALLAAMLLLGTAPWAFAQSTITLTDGQTDPNAYDTTAPASPITFTLATGAATVSGTISGSGAIEKTGAGTLTLSGTSTYTGSTTLSQGRLFLGANDVLPDASAVIVASGTTFDLNGFSDTIGSLAGSGSVSMGTGTLTVGSDHTSTTYSGNLQGDGNLVKTGTGTFTLDNDKINFASTTIAGGVIDTRHNGIGFLGTVAITTGGRLQTSATSIGISTLSADGTGSTLAHSGAISVENSLILTNGANVSASGALAFGRFDPSSASVTGVNSLLSAGGVLRLGSFGGTGTLTIGSGGTVSAGSVSLGASYTEVYSEDDSFVVPGGTGILHLNSGGTLRVGGTNGITSTGGTAHFNLSGGTLQVIGSDLTTSVPATLSLTSTVNTNGFNATLSGVLSGNGGLTKTGAGTLTLSAANTYSGGTIISDGSLALGADDALSANGSLTVGPGTTFDLAGFSTSVRSLAGTGSVTLGSGSLTTGSMFISTTFGGVISGTGSLTKVGAGTQTFSGVNTYSGGITVRGGLVGFSSLANLGGGTVTLDGGGLQWATGNTLDITGSAQFNRTLGAGGGTFDTHGNNVTFANALSGPGAFTKLGTGALTLSGANTYSGVTTLFGGTLRLGANDVMPATNALDISSGTFDLNNFSTTIGSITRGGSITLGSGTLTIGADNTSTTYDGIISGTGNLTKIGSGTLTLNRPYTYTGTTTISGGTLALNDGGSIVGDIVNNAALSMAFAANYGGTISGTGSASFGNVTLSGANTYTGPTTIVGSSSIFRLGANNALPATSALTVGPVTTFDLANFSTSVGSLAGSGTVNLGSGTLTTGGDNTSTTFSGIIEGPASSSFVKTGTGTLAFSVPLGSPSRISFNGNTQITGGLINFTRVEQDFGSGSITTFNTSTITLNGGGLQWATGSTADPSFKFTPLGAAGGTFDTNGNNVTFASALSGTGGLTKTGTGTLALAAGSTYTGTTTISDGTLQFGGGESYSGDIINNAALVFGGSADSTYSGWISGEGSITKSGTGTTTITGNVGDPNDLIFLIPRGSLTIASGALRFTEATGVIVRSLINDGTVIFDKDTTNTFARTITGTGSVLKTGSGTLTLTGANTYSGGTTVAAGTLALADRSDSIDSLGTGPIAVTTGGHLTSNVAFLTASAVTVDGVGSRITTPSLSISSTFAITDGGYVSSGGTGVGSFDAAVTPALTVTGAGSILHVGGLVILRNAFVSIADGGTLQVGGIEGIRPFGGSGEVPLILSGGTLQVTGSHLTTINLVTLTDTATIDTNGFNATLGGVLSGTGSLTKTGAGTLTLSGANTYTGPTSISAGTLAVSGSENLGAGTLAITTGGHLTSSSSNLSLNRVVTADGIGSTIATSGFLEFGSAGTGSVALTDGASLSAGTTLAFGVVGTGSGTGSVTGTNSQLSAGTVLFLGALGGTGTLSVGSGGTVSAGSLVFGGAGGGTGTLHLNSGGTLRVGGTDGIANQGTASFNLSGGTLQLIGSDLTSSVPATLTHSSFIDTNGFNATLSGVLSGSGALTKSGAGTLTLSEANTYTGGTTVSGGTLQLGNGGSTGTILGNISNQGTLAFNRNDDFVFGGVVSGTGGLTLNNGTLRLTQAQTYTGPTQLNAGILVLPTTVDHGLSASSLVTMAAGTAFDISNRTQTIAGLAGTGSVYSFGGSSGSLELAVTTGQSHTFSGSLGGSFADFALTKSGSGTQTLTGTNTYTGGTTVSGGTLALGTGGSLVGDITNHAAVAFDRTDTTTFGGVISGTGSLTKADSGTVILTAANTYTGGTTVSGGTLQLGNGGSTGSILGNVSNQGTLAFNRNDESTYAGVISGTGGMTLHNGILRLTQAQTYTGPTQINAGILVLPTAVDHGLSASSLVTVAAGTALDISNRTQVIAGLDGAGAVYSFGGSSGSLELAVATGQAHTFFGSLGSSFADFALTKSGPGTQTLSGTHPYTGTTTVTGGNLAFTGDFSSNTAVSVTGATSVLSTGGTLQLGQNGTGTLAVTDGATATATSAFIGNGIGGIASTGTVTVSGPGSALHVGSTLNLGYFGTGNLTIADGGSVSTGNLIFAAAPGYSGTLNLDSGGTLQVGGPNGLRNDGTATFNLSGGTLQVIGSALTTSVPATLTGTSTIDTNGLAATFSGALSGTGALTKTGLGALTLSGANTFTGGLSIAAGTVALGADGTLAATSGLNLGTTASPGTLDLTAKSAGFAFGPAQSLTGSGTVSLAPGQALTVAGTFAPGNSPGLITIDGDLVFEITTITLVELGGLTRGVSYDALDVTGALTFGGTLSVTLIDGFDPTHGDSFNLFDFTTGTGEFLNINLPTLSAGLLWDTSALHTSGTLNVSVIPEPSTFAALAGLAALGLAASRRRRTTTPVAA